MRWEGFIVNSMKKGAGEKKILGKKGKAQAAQKKKTGKTTSRGKRRVCPVGEKHANEKNSASAAGKTSVRARQFADTSAGG